MTFLTQFRKCCNNIVTIFCREQQVLSSATGHDVYESFWLSTEMIRQHRGREQRQLTNDIHKTKGQRFSAVPSRLVDDQSNGLLPA